MKNLLKKYLGDDEKVNEFLEEMKNNKIYTSNEENIDIRYNKLKGEHETLTTKEKEAQSLIEQLKQNNQNNESLQAKVSEYEAKIADLEAKNNEMIIDNAIKFKLIEKGAKTSDIDYLMFKMKNQNEELKLDKEGNIKGLDDILDSIKKNYPNNFDDKSKKKVEVLDLEDNPENDRKITKEQFEKMGYQEKVKLYNEDKNLYNELKGKKE